MSQWPSAKGPLERVHLDFFYFKGKQCLLAVDAFTKNIDVKVMRQTTAEQVIVKLGEIFELFGLPRTFVTDNGPPFNSFKFTQFCEYHNVKLLHSPTYHPESNGQEEVSVKIVKSGLNKLVMEHPKETIEELLKRFLAHYRNSPRAVGERTPLELLFSFTPRTKLDFVKEASTTCTIEDYCKFKKGDEVYYRSHYKDHLNWLPGYIVRQKSKYLYLVDLGGGHRTVHISTLRKRKVRFLGVVPEPCKETAPRRLKRERSPESPDTTTVTAPRRSKRNKPPVSYK